MMEYTLEEDTPEEFKKTTLAMHAVDPRSDKVAILDNIDSTSINNNPRSDKTSNNHCAGGVKVITVPQCISASVHPKDTVHKEDGVLQISKMTENPNNYFTYRTGVVEKAVNDCVEQFLDLQEDGPLLNTYLLTLINLWNSDKERLILLTPKTLVIVKYDFIALERLEYKKVPLSCIDNIIIGDLVYPSGSLVPHITGIANGLSNILQNCLFESWKNSNIKGTSAFLQTRNRNTRGIRIMWNKGKPLNFGTKWNPFNNDVPFVTLTFHPLFFYKECTDEKQKILYDVDHFAEMLCSKVVEFQRNNSREETCIIHHNDVLLENYVSIGSVIHNQNSLGFFKVRGKMSF